MMQSEFLDLIRNTLVTDDEVQLLLAYHAGKKLTVQQLLTMSRIPMISRELEKELLAKATAEESAGGESVSAPVPASVPPCPVRQEDSNWASGMEKLSNDEIWDYYRLDAIGDARLYNRLNRQWVVYVRYWERFLIWHGHHWTDDDYNAAYQRIEVISNLYERLIGELDASKADVTGETDEEIKRKMHDIDKRIDRVRSRIRSLRSRSGQDNVMAQVTRVQDPLLVQPDMVDARYYSIACPNGVVDLRTGDFRAGRPSDYILTACETPFDQELLNEEDPCPETTRFLTASMNGNTEVVDFIFRLLGYGLIRDRRDHVFPIFWGPHGRNGKDTLIKLVTKVLGKALSGDVSVDIFLQSGLGHNSSAPSPDILAFKGMCIAWINEAEKNQRFDLPKLKKLTGGGLITARGLQDKKMTTFRQTHLPIMTTNEIPVARAEDSAFWSRCLIVRWELSFVDDPKEEWERPADKDLDKKIQAEAPGVLARMVRGAMQYMAGGLQVPAQVQAWTNAERDSLDDISAFFEECCILEPKQDNPDSYSTRIKAKDLYTAWSLWYAENRDRKHIPAGKTLGILLDKREIPKKMSNGTWRLGLCLKDDWQDRVDNESSGSGYSRRRMSSED